MMQKTEGILLWEIWKDGKNGQVFEVTNCAFPEYVGKRFRVKEENDYQGHYKALLDDETGNIAELYGCFGTAWYKAVDTYKVISFREAMDRLSKGYAVYVRISGWDSYRPFCLNSDLHDFGIDTLLDLDMADLAVKEDI